jgi:hypothetical protein
LFDYFISTIFIYLALLFGNELPQHPQQAGIIDPYCDVASIVKGNTISIKYLGLDALD